MPDTQAAIHGVDHVAFPTFDPIATVKFYRDTLGFPVVHTVCATGWGAKGHPDFIHFFFDAGNGARIAFFYYFGFAKPQVSARGDAYSTFGREVPGFFVRSHHLALHVDTEEQLLAYRDKLDRSDWPVEVQVVHETIESIYVHDPNGYLLEFTRDLRPVTAQEIKDAELTIDALLAVVGEGDPTLAGLYEHKADLILAHGGKIESAEVLAENALT
jgi:catechol 2,3-dioxygenase-like lactoylglutathione lyase family enzyme